MHRPRVGFLNPPLFPFPRRADADGSECYAPPAMARRITTAIAAILAGTSVFAVVRWLRSKPQQDDARSPEQMDKLIEEADLESFPASDPPAWTLGEDRVP